MNVHPINLLLCLTAYCKYCELIRPQLHPLSSFLLLMANAKCEIGTVVNEVLVCKL